MSPLTLSHESEGSAILTVWCEQEDEEGGSDEGEGSGDEEGESRAAKRQRLNETTILRRRERRLWEEKRNRLMFDYTQFTYYGRSVSYYYFYMQHLFEHNIILVKLVLY